MLESNLRLVQSEIRLDQSHIGLNLRLGANIYIYILDSIGIKNKHKQL